MRLARLWLVAAGAAVLLAAAVTSASARRLELSSQHLGIVWRPLVFATTGGVRVSCPITLAGSIHSRTLSKVSGQLIGYINATRFASTEPPCTGGTIRARSETLPWHVQYNSFAGTLPRITSVTVTLVGARFEVLSAGVRCEFGTSQTSPAFIQGALNASSVITSFRALEEHHIPLSGEFLCGFAGELFFAGTAAVEGGATVRLVA